MPKKQEPREEPPAKLAKVLRAAQAQALGDDDGDGATPPGSQPAVDIVDRLKSLAAEKRQARERAVVEVPPPPPSVSAGPVGALTEVMVNPTADKILEFTDLDRNQVSLIPQLLLISDVWEQCIEIAAYRSDTVRYAQKYKKERPVWPDLMNKYVFRIAQCRRSLGGKTLKALEDLTLAEIDKRDEPGLGGGDGFND